MAGDSRIIVVQDAGALPTSAKESADAFRYTFDFTTWLDTGETISTATSSGSSAPFVVGSATVDAGGKKVYVLVSNGTSGLKYTVTISAAITNGQTKTTKLSVTIK